MVVIKNIPKLSIYGSMCVCVSAGGCCSGSATALYVRERVPYSFFNFDLDFLNGVQNSIALHAQIYLITNSFGDQQAVECRRHLLYADFD
jgi:hypothetical protein